MADPLAGLDPDFAAKVRALIRLSGGKVTIKSGFRSVERQQQLWDAAVKKYGSAKAARKWVAPPGRSNHNHGKAVDLAGDLGLAARLAPQVGLTRPMSWEPWHYEPAGHRGHKDAHTTPPVGVTVPPPESAAKTGPPSVSQVFGELGTLLLGSQEDEEVMV